MRSILLQTYAFFVCANSANYKAVQSLSLSTLNYERTSILLQYFMEDGKGVYILSFSWFHKIHRLAPCG